MKRFLAICVAREFALHYWEFHWPHKLTLLRWAIQTLGTVEFLYWVDFWRRVG